MTNPAFEELRGQLKATLSNVDVIRMGSMFSGWGVLEMVVNELESQWNKMNGPTSMKACGLKFKLMLIYYRTGGAQKMSYMEDLLCRLVENNIRIIIITMKSEKTWLRCCSQDDCTYTQNKSNPYSQHWAAKIMYGCLLCSSSCNCDSLVSAVAVKA